VGKSDIFIIPVPFGSKSAQTSINMFAFSWLKSLFSEFIVSSKPSRIMAMKRLRKTNYTKMMKVKKYKKDPKCPQVTVFLPFSSYN